MGNNNSNMNIPSLPNLSPQSSTYSTNKYDGNQSDVMSVKSSGRLYTNSHHLRQESNATQKTAYSEGDAKSQLNDINEKSPTPPLPSDVATLSPSWQRYINHLETKNREISTLFLRADTNLKKYTKAIVPFQERIQNLELQNQTRKKTIDKLNKRIIRRNETIKRLKQQNYAETNRPSTGTPQFGPQSQFVPMTLSNQRSASVSSNDMINTANHATTLSPEQEMYFNEVQTQFHQNSNNMNMRRKHQHQQQRNTYNQKQYALNKSNVKHKYASSSQIISPNKKRKRKNRHNVILQNNGNSINGHISGGSVASIQSAPQSNPNNDNENSIIGSITSMAYGYIMGSGTSGNY